VDVPTHDPRDADEARIAAWRSGSGPPVLLLHGFPETHLMWRFVAPRLASEFTVVCADLRGYGASGCPASAADHAPYSKRAMALDMVRLMDRLGFRTFSVAGHDRGGRVAYRLALDHPDRVAALAVLDVLPTLDTWDRADSRLALGYWPWSLLAQPEPLPEQVLTAAADAIVDHALAEWGAAVAAADDARDAYVSVLRDPAHAHAICEEYRAAAGVDRDHDAADRDQGRRIVCPVRVLWAAGGPVNTWYADAGGPLGIWSRWAAHVSGRAVPGGHFFPEVSPHETYADLAAFFTGHP
jgi:haloacetate dehalogenase